MKFGERRCARRVSRRGIKANKAIVTQLMYASSFLRPFGIIANDTMTLVSYVTSRLLHIQLREVVGGTVLRKLEYRDAIATQR